MRKGHRRTQSATINLNSHLEENIPPLNFKKNQYDHEICKLLHQSNNKVV
jgi:hypothetical protein